MRTAERARRGRATEIVSVAADLFATTGYHQVGMRDIADALGIRGASLYHHYRSKEEILYAVCLTVTKEPVEQNLPLLDAAGTPGQRLAALVRAHLTHLVGRRVEHLVGLHELNALSSEHREEIDDYLRYYHRRVRDVIAAGERSGEFIVPDPRLAAFAVLDALNGISGWYRDTGALGISQIAERYVALLIHGLLRSNAPPEDSADDPSSTPAASRW